jgi:hypothetical protein
MNVTVPVIRKASACKLTAQRSGLRQRPSRGPRPEVETLNDDHGDAVQGLARPGNQITFFVPVNAEKAVGAFLQHRLSMSRHLSRRRLEMLDETVE